MPLNHTFTDDSARTGSDWLVPEHSPQNCPVSTSHHWTPPAHGGKTGELPGENPVTATWLVAPAWLAGLAVSAGPPVMRPWCRLTRRHPVVEEIKHGNRRKAPPRSPCGKSRRAHGREGTNDKQPGGSPKHGNRRVIVGNDHHFEKVGAINSDNRIYLSNSSIQMYL